MMIFEKARENAEAIKQGGARAIEQAKLAGVPAYYVDPAVGDGIVREMPDGTRQRIQLIDGEVFVLEAIGPRTQSSK